jgi:hypothetical protein
MECNRNKILSSMETKVFDARVGGGGSTTVTRQSTPHVCVDFASARAPQL